MPLCVNRFFRVIRLFGVAKIVYAQAHGSFFLICKCSKKVVRCDYNYSVANQPKQFYGQAQYSGKNIGPD